MNPSQLQAQIDHPRLIDYFIWPKLRDYLIMSGISSAPESMAAQFIGDIGVKWPFHLRDTCNYQVSKGTYTFSKEFNEAYDDVDSWVLKAPDLSMYPPLTPGNITTVPVPMREWPQPHPRPVSQCSKPSSPNDFWDTQWVGMMPTYSSEVLDQS